MKRNVRTDLTSSGPTAIAPGYRQVVCDVSAPVSPTRAPSDLPWDPMLQNDQMIMASDGESPVGPA